MCNFHMYNFTLCDRVTELNITDFQGKKETFTDQRLVSLENKKYISSS